MEQLQLDPEDRESIQILDRGKDMAAVLAGQTQDHVHDHGDLQICQFVDRIFKNGIFIAAADILYRFGVDGLQAQFDP